MKRFAVVCSLLALTFPAIVGCEKKAKTEHQETVSGPGGKTTTTDTHTVESSGQNPPANTQGETAK